MLMVLAGMLRTRCSIIGPGHPGLDAGIQALDGNLAVTANPPGLDSSLPPGKSIATSSLLQDAV
jgi:hypothetical protein